MPPYRFQWVLKGPYVLMDLYGTLWVLKGHFAFLSGLIGLYRSLFVFRDSNVSLWVFIGLIRLYGF